MAIMPTNATVPAATIAFILFIFTLQCYCNSIFVNTVYKLFTIALKPIKIVYSKFY